MKPETRARRAAYAQRFRAKLPPQSVGEYLYQCRRRGSLGTEDVARALGHSDATVSRYESGKIAITEGNIRAVAAAYEADYATLRRWAELPPDASPPPITTGSRTSVPLDLPTDPLEAGKALLEAAPEQIVIAVYALLAGAADDKRALWQRRIRAAWERSATVPDTAILPEGATPADLMALRFRFFWDDLFGVEPPDG